MKLVRYKDVCAALIPMIADMMQRGDIEPAINILKALGALEDVDLVKAVREYCNTYPDGCADCKYYRDLSGGKGCIFTSEEW